MAALWLVVLVGVTGYELSVRARTRRLAVANALEFIQARAAAEAGLESARSVLEQRLRQPFASRVRSTADAAIDPLGDLSLIRADTLALGNVRESTDIQDAGAFLQINRATEDDVRRFLIALPMDASAADRAAQRILDWRDPDSFRRAHGAEREDYLKAAPFASIVKNAIEAADLKRPANDPVPYTGTAQVDIPEYAAWAAEFGQNFSAVIAGGMSVDDALDRSQQITERVMKEAGYIK